jgi:hypothetical protein
VPSSPSARAARQRRTRSISAPIAKQRTVVAQPIEMEIFILDLLVAESEKTLADAK